MNKKLLSLRIISGILFIQLSIGFAAPAAMPSTAIPLNLYDGLQQSNRPFFSINLTGSALKGNVTANFDSGATTLILPQGCLNPDASSYKIIQTNVLDEWNQPATLVQGAITLTANDGITTYTVPDFQFFVTPSKTCDINSGDFINFGVSMTLYAYKGAKPGCAMSFFKAYSYNTRSDYGVTFYAKHANTTQPYITIGAVDPSLYPTNQISQLTPMPPQNCGGKMGVISYNGVSPYNKVTLAKVEIKIGSTPQQVIISNRTDMVDSGGGMTILSDDKNGSLAQQLQTNNLGSACPAYISWLDGCTCVFAKQLIEITWNNTDPSSKRFFYSYHSTNPEFNQQKAVAICPRNNPNDPYILPNGINTGFELFNAANSVMFDFKSGQAGIQ